MLCRHQAAVSRPLRRRSWRIGALVVVLAVVAAACTRGSADGSVVARSPEPMPFETRRPQTTTTTEPTTTTVATTATTTTTTTTTTTEPPTTTTAPPGRAPWSINLYAGLGAWLDVFDWTSAYSNNPLGVEAIDKMAAEGVQTVYIQTSRFDHPDDLIEPQKLARLIERAHGHGMHVIAWYLPTHVNTEIDLRRLMAAVSAGVDGLVVNIESLEEPDVDRRNRELIRLSQLLRERLPGKPIGTAILPPVAIEDINPNFWPRFPWAEIAPYYDVWMPMAYWTNRRGEWRDGYRYPYENARRVREHIGQPNAPVHPVGGIGHELTIAELQEYVRAVHDLGALGGSIYDFAVTTEESWPVLRALIRD